ncbi:MAG: ATP-dependent DNA helicase RecG [Clostridia bacterium]|nr:ATP-dependent DNA helicase RecG [Clostridia bacterium]
MSLFYEPIYNLKGVGKKRAELFYKLGVKSIGQLLEFYPKRYIDFSKIDNIEDIENDKTVCLRGKIISNVLEFKNENGLLISSFKIKDKTGVIEVIFFNNRFIRQNIKFNEEYLFMGKIKYSYGKYQLVSPLYRSVNYEVKIEPIYSQTDGLSTNIIRNCIKNALELLPENIKDTIPEDVRDKYELCSLDFALKNIHFPKNKASLKEAQYRLYFEEMLVFYLSAVKYKEYNKTINDYSIKKSFKDDFIKLLPFDMTNSQNKVLDECYENMITSRNSMARLIQGDVGCGKTVIAAGLAYCAAKNDVQTAFMVPTEILANQHYRFFKEIFAKSDINIEIITSSTKKSDRKDILNRLKNGRIDILIGTHALLSDDIEFLKLSLVITDEQHKFGVNQRNIISKKGTNPHIAVMSATPIPRTLALVMYGDYDVSTIDEIPGKRPQIKTMLVCENRRERVFEFIKSLIDKGHQGYIVCPNIENNTQIGMNSVEMYKEVIKNSILSGYKAAFLHGKMKDCEKQDLMKSFLQGDIDILVSTTVIEVGVDVGNACFMIIENAERFGLSQLHQLRGRVGRSDIQSYCILVSANENPQSIERLEFLCRTTNGFKIAEYDLKTRGPGDFFGIRQHGELNKNLLRAIDNPSVFSLIVQAGQYILKEDKQLNSDKYRFLKGKVKYQLKKNMI